MGAVEFPIKTKTSNDLDIELYKDGTWKFLIKDSYQKPSTSTRVLKSKKGFIEIWYNPSKWKKTKQPASPAEEFSLIHKTGDGYAIMIIESAKMSRSKLKKQAIRNAKKVDPDAYISLEKVVKVNGKKVLIMNIRGTVEKANFVYHSAYWSGSEGVFQIITYSTSELFNEHYQDLDDILAGIIIKSKKK